VWTALYSVCFDVGFIKWKSCVDALEEATMAFGRYFKFLMFVHFLIRNRAISDIRPSVSVTDIRCI